MILKAPNFWFKKKNEEKLLSLLLSPVSKIWEFEAKRRIQSGACEKMPIPIICIGNLIIGGSGKTPVTQALQNIISNIGFKPHVLSRGYGGKLKGPVYVSKIHSFTDVGDEPILLSKTGPVLISKNKKMGVLKAWKSGANVVLLDDGFQNTSIAKDFSIIVIDSQILFGNERVIPSGPLREPISSGLSRADAIVIVNNDNNYMYLPKKLDFELSPNVPIINAVIKPNIILENWQGKSVIAFSGIAHPEKFFNTLKNLGCIIEKTYSFRDHYPFKNYEIEKLKSNAKIHKSILVTTEKDFMRIPVSQQKYIKKLPVKIEFQNKEILEKAILKILTKKGFEDSNSSISQ